MLIIYAKTVYIEFFKTLIKVILELQQGDAFIQNLKSDI
jgi:hypothetical protein